MSNALRVVEPNSPSTLDWNVMKEQAAMLVKTGFLPQAIKTPEQAVAIMLKGRELGVPSMYALSNIVVIQGKPTANAELMLALIYRDHGDGAMQIKESTPEICTIVYCRRHWDMARTHSFTIADAKTAGLTTDTWRKYPAAMLRARCISAVARMAFPDSIGGMYTPEELGAEVAVSSEGTVDIIGEARIVPGPEIPAHAVVTVDPNTGEIQSEGDTETGEIVAHDNTPDEHDNIDEEPSGNPFLQSIREAANKEALEVIAEEIAQLTKAKVLDSAERDVLVTAYRQRQQSLGLRPGGSTGK